MEKAKRLRKLKHQLEMYEAFLKDLEVKKKNNAPGPKCLRECVDDIVIPLIEDAKTTNEAKKSLERNFGVSGIYLIEDKEFGESHCA